MVKLPVFEGACTALVTPFNEHGIDYERHKKNIDLQYENGSSAIVVCGTTGEVSTLSSNEYDELIRFTVRETQGRMKVIAGIGGNDTEKALKNAENAKYAAADAVLMVTPYYNKGTQSGLVAHFTHVADKVDIPLILYNIPSRTGIGIAQATYRELSKHPNINGVKEASGDFSLAVAVKSECGDDLHLWSGNDDNTVPLMAIGALGVISAVGNVIPSVMSKLCSLCSENDYKAASALYAKYAQLISTLFIETNPIPVKTAMKLLGTDSGIMRLPLTEMSENNLAVLRAVMRDSGLNV